MEIKQGTIEKVVKLSLQIPEFINPHGATEYHQRLNNCKHLILIAYKEHQAVGFKVGYDKGDTFYSWMGGVLPNHRKSGIAAALAKQQEKWALKNGFNNITFKTMNKHKGMLIFAIKNGFDIIEVLPKDTIDIYRIILKKEL